MIVMIVITLLVDHLDVYIIEAKHNEEHGETVQ